jgi:hypothetical protein
MRRTIWIPWLLGSAAIICVAHQYETVDVVARVCKGLAGISILIWCFCARKMT